MSTTEDPARPKLFTPLTLGGQHDPIVLQHRISKAPLARLRADDDGVLPEYAATYYAQRATPGGLIVTEPTSVSAQARGAFGAPGVYTTPQLSAWRQVAQAVHDKRGVLFMSLWHAGRLSHPALQPDGALPVSSSASMPLDANRTARTRDGERPLVTPRVLATHEIAGVCDEYRVAAENALAAGCDGVELHAGNGDLLEQFLHDGVNDRADAYGGSIENRARLVFEVLDAVLTRVPASRVAVRLSPFSKSCGQFDSDPEGHYPYVLQRLNAYDLAYVHLIEPRGYHYVATDLPKPYGATALFRPFYRGVLAAVCGYDRQTAVDVVAQGHADFVAIGRYFISNPDLVRRFRLGAPLAAYDRATSYGPGEQGYTDYPFLEDEREEEEGRTDCSEV